MIYDLKPYPAYKDSGVPWLGKVPEHWKLQSLGSLTTARSQRNRPDLPLLSVVREKGVIPRSSMRDGENHNFIPDDLSNYKVVHEGDLVINKMKAWQGSLGISPQDGIVSPAYYVFKFQTINRKFSHILLRSKPYVAFFGQVSDGVRIGQWDLSMNGLKKIPVVMPPLTEQSSIIHYLAYIDRRVRRYIRAKQKLIKLLEEQKQVIIHQAVTRGLDSNSRFKPYGMEWLEEIPETWEVLPLKHCVSTKITDGPHETPQFIDDGIPFMSAESMINGRFDFNHRRGFISRELHEFYCRKCHPQRYDIFMCKSGATTGKVAIVETDNEFSVWSPLALIRANRHKVHPILLFFILQARYLQFQVQDSWSYGTQPNLSMAAMERLLVLLPPLGEQQQLLEYLQDCLSKIEAAIYSADKEIFFLREYRIRLIADVVTGKMDVREASVNLPEETDEIETLDDSLNEDGELESNQIEDEQAGELEDEVLA